MQSEVKPIEMLTDDELKQFYGCFNNEELAAFAMLLLDRTEPNGVVFTYADDYVLPLDEIWQLSELEAVTLAIKFAGLLQRRLQEAGADEWSGKQSVQGCKRFRRS